MKENKYLIGKSDLNNKEFDTIQKSIFLFNKPKTFILHFFEIDIYMHILIYAFITVVNC